MRTPPSQSADKKKIITELSGQIRLMAWFINKRMQRVGCDLSTTAVSMRAVQCTGTIYMTVK
jgi:hypothetical protein